MHRGWLRGWQSIAIVTCLFTIPVAAFAIPVTKATPTLTTTPSYNGTELFDKAVLTSGNNPTGTITFVLHDPSNAVVDTEQGNVSGGTSTTLGFVALTAGTYTWIDTYNGDSFNNSVPANPETITIQIGAPNPAPTPEPSSLILLGTGVLGLFEPIRRKLLPRK